MSSFELLICAGLICVSGVMSASEIAIFSLSRFQLRAIKDHLHPSVYRRIKRLLADPGGLLVVILVINEIVNISLSAIIAHMVSRSGFAESSLMAWAPRWGVDALVGTLVTAPVVLFGCEITPKVVGARANQLVAGLTASPLGLIYDLMKPVRVSIIKLVSRMSRFAGTDGGSAQLAHGDGVQSAGILKESDFLFMVEEGHREGAIHETELSLIRRVFELDDRTVAEILKPLTDVFTLPAQTTVRSALAAVRAQKYSRIPIMGQYRRVVGVLYSKDVLHARSEPELLNSAVSSVMRKPIVVSPNLRLNTLFRRLKQQRTHLAVVQDPDGLAIGVVTMDDVLEALFEDLLPEEEEGS